MERYQSVKYGEYLVSSINNKYQISRDQLINLLLSSNFSNKDIHLCTTKKNIFLKPDIN